MARRILVIEDEADARELIQEYLAGEDYSADFAEDGAAGIERLKRGGIDILVTDVRLPRIGGEELVSYVHAQYPALPIIVMTGYGTVEGAVSFLRAGAFDYITKPFTRHVFTHRLHLASRHLELQDEVDKLRAAHRREGFDAILGNHPSMVRILSMLPSIAKTDAAVLILGESGTGKEMLARAVHAQSRRAERAFVAVNCGALPETLLESELFGYRRGAFTDARADRTGLVEEAHLGTLFLDEVGEMSPALQVRLLRVLQEQAIRRVGESQERPVDVRVLAATNADLTARVRAGSFREDLYYRLNVVPLRLPPLRERRSDLPLMIEHFLRRFATEYERHIDGIAPEVMRHLLAHDWPGNVRELINTVQRLVVLTQGPLIDAAALERASLADGSAAAPAGGGLASAEGFMEEKRRLLARFEREYVARCLEASGGNIAAAARLARLDRKNFWQLMKKHAIDAKASA